MNFIKEKSECPLEYLEELRGYCLHNFICAIEQIENSNPGSVKHKMGVKWMRQILKNLFEVEALIEEAMLLIEMESR